MISIIEAREDKVQRACDIMIEASEWLNQKNMPLWRREDLTLEIMQTHSTRGALFLALVEGDPAGTIVIQAEDKVYWPEITDNSSLFFHKLAVRRKYAGMGVSNALMAYAYELAKKKNKSFLRMDCSALHTQLRKFYESNGFEFVDQKQVGHLLVDRLFKAVI